MDNKKPAPILIGLVVIIGLLIAGYFYFLKPASEPKKEGVVGAAEEVSAQVPEIATNPGESVPEVNPLDRANPFKYKNPLR